MGYSDAKNFKQGISCFAESIAIKKHAKSDSCGNLSSNLDIAIPKDVRPEFAKIIGVSAESLRRWIVGAAYPRSDHLIKIAEALDCTIDFLIYNNFTADNIQEKKSARSRDKEVEELKMKNKEYLRIIQDLRAYNDLLYEKVDDLKRGVELFWSCL
jgi:transcriptional regulator with XRE-family HTH domain